MLRECSVRTCERERTSEGSSLAGEESITTRAHIWSESEAWYVGTSFDAGLPVPTFDAALTLADLWLRLNGSGTILVRSSDARVALYSDPDQEGPPTNATMLRIDPADVRARAADRAGPRLLHARR
jgi:hypothetical protein